MTRAEHHFHETAADLVRRLDEAARTSANARAHTWMWGVGAIAAVVGGFFAVPAANAATPPLDRNLLPAVIWAALVLGCGARAIHLGRQRLDERKLNAARRLVALLRADVPAAALVELDVDFRGYESTPAKGAHASRSRWQQSWLSLGLPLADGTRARLSVTDIVSRKTKSKRKYTKVKERMSSAVTVALRLGRRYPPASDLARQLSRRRIPKSLKVAQVQGKGRLLRATFRTPVRLRVSRGTAEVMPELADERTALAVLRWMYGGIAAARA